MAPKTKATPEEVRAELIEKFIFPDNPEKRGKNIGINKDIKLVTPTPTFDKLWPKDEV